MDGTDTILGLLFQSMTTLASWLDIIFLREDL